MASNTQQFGIRGSIGQHQPAMAAKVCGICTFVEHPTNMCPTLQETESDQLENVGAIAAWKTAISPRTELGVIRSSTIRVHTEYILETSKVLAICELQQYAIPAERDRHHPRPQNVDWTVSQHCEPITVGWIQQPPLSNHSKSERKRQCSHSQKWKRTASTYIAVVAKIS
ncbi:hypothetical protein CR513_16113, partial [Mucuna pruriens]